MSSEVIPVRNYLFVWAALIVLLLATVGIDLVDLGWGNTALAIGIAAVKALLVATFFMHLKYSKPIVWLFAGAGIFWLGTLITLGMSDYLTRGLWGQQTW